MTSCCHGVYCSVVELASCSLETAWKTCSLCTRSPLPSSHNHGWITKQSPSQNSSRERDPTSSGCEPLRTKSPCEKKAVFKYRRITMSCYFGGGVLLACETEISKLSTWFSCTKRTSWPLSSETVESPLSLQPLEDRGDLANNRLKWETAERDHLNFSSCINAS